MAIRIRITNTTTSAVLAAHDIPEAALPDIQEAFPGTPAQTADAALMWMLRALRVHVGEVTQSQAGNVQAIKDAATAREVAQAARIAALQATWPVE